VGALHPACLLADVCPPVYRLHAKTLRRSHDLEVLLAGQQSPDLQRRDLLAQQVVLGFGLAASGLVSAFFGEVIEHLHVIEPLPQTEIQKRIGISAGSASMSLPLLWLLVAILAFAAVLLAAWLRIRYGLVYFALGVAAWVALFKSGVAPLVIGLAMGLLLGGANRLQLAAPAARV